MSQEAFKIRRAEHDDAEAVLEIYGPVVERTPVSFEEDIPSEAEVGRRIEESICWLVLEKDSRVAGYAYAAPFHPRAAYRWSAEVSVYVRDGHRGEGMGRGLLGQLLDELEERDFVNVYGGVALPNDASVRLFESFGFKQVALYEKVGFKLGRWHDVAWFGLRFEPVTESPTEPVY